MTNITNDNDNDDDDGDEGFYRFHRCSGGNPVRTSRGRPGLDRHCTSDQNCSHAAKESSLFFQIKYRQKL